MTVAVSNAELNQMRSDAETLTLPDTCTIQRAGNTVDSVGSVTPDWETLYTDVACRLYYTAYVRGRPEEAEQWVSIARWVLRLHWDQDIQAGDQVLIDTDTYQVVATQDAHNFRVLRRVFLIRVD
jgi:hypothetical protein